MTDMNSLPNEVSKLAAARAHFPALDRWIYMDVAGRGVLSREVRAALDAHLDDRMLNGADKDRFFALIERTRGRFADLVNAREDEIAITKNVSEGLNMIATAIDWRPGDNVILCPDLEHPNNVYPWLNLKRHGVETRAVTPRNHHIPVEDIVAKIDDRTRVVAASTVTFAPGFRTDIDCLGTHCRERGVLLLVDAAQSAGILQTDVQSSRIDALAVSTQKGLLGLYGMGFLYCRSDWAEKLHPAYLARFGVDVGDAHEAVMGDYAFSLARGARRFDVGNYNFAAAAAVDASMEQLLSWNVRLIEQHVLSLSHSLARGLLALGLPVVGGDPGEHMAHIVTVGSMSDRHYGSDDDLLSGLYEHLTANRVKLSIRKGALRFSLHVYNDTNDIEEVLRLTRQYLGARSAAR